LRLAFGHKAFIVLAMKHRVRATVYGLIATVAMAVLIYVGSRRLANFDAALVGYTFATLFAVIGIVYRYGMWLERPPTAVCWRARPASFSQSTQFRPESRRVRTAVGRGLRPELVYLSS
jgi:hypothetical protein